MKLIIAVLQEEDVILTIASLTEQGFRVTRLSTTGGFLKVGNTTLIIGVPESQVEDVMHILEKTCQQRKQPVPFLSPGDDVFGGISGITEVVVGGAVGFILDVETYKRFV